MLWLTQIQMAERIQTITPRLTQLYLEGELDEPFQYLWILYSDRWNKGVVEPLREMRYI